MYCIGWGLSYSIVSNFGVIDVVKFRLVVVRVVRSRNMGWCNVEFISIIVRSVVLFSRVSRYMSLNIRDS